MSYLARLHELKAGNRPAEAVLQPTRQGFAGFEGDTRRHFCGNSPPANDPAQWAAALASLDASRTPGGIDRERWRTLLADARWIARHHTETAAAFGWTASDLFGIDPLPGWGGVADRLKGARRLAFTARVAHWSDGESEGWLWRHSLRPKPLLWSALQ